VVAERNKKAAAAHTFQTAVVTELPAVAAALEVVRQEKAKVKQLSHALAEPLVAAASQTAATRQLKQQTKHQFSESVAAMLPQAAAEREQKQQLKQNMGSQLATAVPVVADQLTARRHKKQHTMTEFKASVMPLVADVASEMTSRRSLKQKKPISQELQAELTHKAAQMPKPHMVSSAKTLPTPVRKAIKKGVALKQTEMMITASDATGDVMIADDAADTLPSEAAMTEAATTAAPAATPRKSLVATALGSVLSVMDGLSGLFAMAHAKELEKEAPVEVEQDSSTVPTTAEFMPQEADTEQETAVETTVEPEQEDTTAEDVPSTEDDTVAEVEEETRGVAMKLRDSIVNGLASILGMTPSATCEERVVEDAQSMSEAEPMSTEVPTDETEAAAPTVAEVKSTPRYDVSCRLL